MPEGCRVLYNSNGTAPGIIMEDKDSRIILLPGPPNELVPMFEEQVYPYLRGLQPEIICSKMVKLCGIGESSAETKILDLISEQKNPTVAPYAKIILGGAKAAGQYNYIGTLLCRPQQMLQTSRIIPHHALIIHG